MISIIKAVLHSPDATPEEMEHIKAHWLASFYDALIAVEGFAISDHADQCSTEGVTPTPFKLDAEILAVEIV